MEPAAVCANIVDGVAEQISMSQWRGLQVKGCRASAKFSVIPINLLESSLLMI